MARVRFYYDVTVDEVMEKYEYENEEEITDEDIIDRAKTLFAYDIQDRDINVYELECEIISYE